ncbi:hypothetical protein [Burkholderia sp. TSV86]|uniref:hypothetical protein n=1 Tax=Burkholderia sp. TSV86 TaxID=1385594 RepID=UPI000A929FBA|nr:hypothetical protein [Burkholderia sp. TSV86]
MDIGRIGFFDLISSFPFPSPLLHLRHVLRYCFAWARLAESARNVAQQARQFGHNPRLID